MNYAIAHEESGHRGAFFLKQDGKRLAEMTYSRANPSLVIIDHTEVDASLGGKGVGRQLLDAAVKWARETKTKVTATCVPGRIRGAASFRPSISFAVISSE